MICSKQRFMVIALCASPAVASTCMACHGTGINLRHTGTRKSASCDRKDCDLTGWLYFKDSNWKYGADCYDKRDEHFRAIMEGKDVDRKIRVNLRKIGDGTGLYQSFCPLTQHVCQLGKLKMAESFGLTTEAFKKKYCAPQPGHFFKPTKYLEQIGLEKCSVEAKLYAKCPICFECSWCSGTGCLKDANKRAELESKLDAELKRKIEIEAELKRNQKENNPSLVGSEVLAVGSMLRRRRLQTMKRLASMERRLSEEGRL